MSLNFGQIPLLTTELAALEHLKIQCIMFDWIFFILAGNQDYHKRWKEFEFQPDQTSDSGVSCPLASGKIPIDLK